jgi:hypothetical protein
MTYSNNRTSEEEMCGFSLYGKMSASDKADTYKFLGKCALFLLLGVIVIAAISFTFFIALQGVY